MTTDVEIQGGVSAARPGLLSAGLRVGAATTFASAANYLSNVVLGRGLGPTQFADAALVVSGLLLLSAMALGLQLTAARAIAAGARENAVRTVRRRAAVAGVSVGLLIVVVAPVVASAFNMGSSLPVLVLGVGVPIYFMLAVARGAAQAGHAFGRLAFSIGLEAAARLAVTAACVAGGLGPTGAAIALCVSFAAALAPLRVSVAARAPGADTAEPALPRSVLGATLLLLVGQVIISNGDLWVVAARVPDEAGVYAAVALIGRLVFIAAWSVITVVFPSLVSGGERRSQGALLARAVALTAGFGGVLTLGAALFAKPLMSSVVGDGFAGGARLLWPYALATTLFVVANLLAVADVAAGRVVVPGVVAIGAAVQTVVLLAGASAGVAWVIWAQVVLMAALLVASFLASPHGRALFRRRVSCDLVSLRALGPA